MTHDHDSIMAATAEGAAAASEGRSERDNPYALEDSARFGAWLAGFISGDSSGRSGAEPPRN